MSRADDKLGDMLLVELRRLTELHALDRRRRNDLESQIKLTAEIIEALRNLIACYGIAPE